MRPQDFRKLAMYVTDKQRSLYDAGKLVTCTVFMKNDPNECKIHICDDKESKDFTFFEHDDYHNSKFEIDEIFKLLNV